jgi:hypothetical protein
VGAATQSRYLNYLATSRITCRKLLPSQDRTIATRCTPGAPGAPSLLQAVPLQAPLGLMVVSMLNAPPPRESVNDHHAGPWLPCGAARTPGDSGRTVPSHNVPPSSGVISSYFTLRPLFLRCVPSYGAPLKTRADGTAAGAWWSPRPSGVIGRNVVSPA